MVDRRRVSGGRGAGRVRRQRVAAGRQAVATATPVVDPNYIYNQLFDMSYNDVYRVSGADGPRGS